MRVINVPFKLISENNISDADVKLNRLHQLTIHWPVLSELRDLLFQLRHDFIFKGSGQVMLLREYARKLIEVPEGLIFVPQKLVLESTAVDFDVEFDWN